MVSIKYDTEADAIVAVIEDNFGRVRVEDVTKQALDTAFECLAPKGLATIAGYCEYEAHGMKFKVRVVKDEVGGWNDVGNVSIDDEMTVAICSQCKKELTADRFDFWDYDFCPYCGSKLK